MKKAVIYARSGVVDRVSIERQRIVCRKKAEELGLTISHEFIDNGSSGKKFDRPALQELISHVVLESVDAVIIDLPEKLSRDALKLLMLQRFCDRMEVWLIFAHPDYDMQAGFVRTIQQAIAAFASEDRR